MRILFWGTPAFAVPPLPYPYHALEPHIDAATMRLHHDLHHQAYVDKLNGAERLAGLLGFDLAQSVGAGDTPMDSFLRGCGLAVQVGPLDLEHKGRTATVKVPDPAALGEVLRRLATLQQDAAA